MRARPRLKSRHMLAILACGALLAGALLHSRPANLSRRLYNDGQFRHASIEARRALNNQGDNQALKQQVLRADIQWLVPLWQETLLAGDYADAFSLLASARPPLSGQAESESLIGLLTQMTRLSHLMADLRHDGLQSLIEHQERMRLIGKSWESIPSEKEDLAARITEIRADFKVAWIVAQQHLAQLRSLQSLAVIDIESLLEDVDHGLIRDALAQVDIYIGNFRAEHPDLELVESLQLDLIDYRYMLKAYHEDRLPDLVKLRDKKPLRTSLFERHARRRFDARWPPTEVIARYIAAEKAWQAGELDTAFDITLELTTQPRGEIAARHLLRLEAVSRRYDDLLSRRGDEDFMQLLEQYKADLDPSRDQFFIRQLEQWLKPGPAASPAPP